MKSIFKPSDLKKIEAVLGVKGKTKGNNIRFEIKNKTQHREIAVEIYPIIKIGAKQGNLVSVYTSSSYLQLQFCSGYVVSESLGEVTFISDNGDKVSGIIVEREGGCSFYANVDRSLLSGDFRQLALEVMLSGVALSLTESLLPEKKSSASKKKQKK